MTFHSIFSRPMRRGFSLIEVAIALAIFMIGALVVLRIFPTGLGLVEKSADTRRADNLNASVLARYRSAQSLPEGVYNMDSTGNWQYFEGFISRSAALEKNKISLSLPISTLSTDYTASALDNFKGVAGETARIVRRAGRAFAFTQFPVVGGVRVYRETQLSGVRLAAPTTTGPLGDLDWNEATTPDGTPVSPAPGEVFLVSYNFKSSALGAPAVWRQTRQEVAFSAGVTSVDRPTTDAAPIFGEVEASLRSPLVPIDVSASNELRDLAQCGAVDVTSFVTPLEDRVKINYATRWNLILQETQPSPALDPAFASVPDARQINLSLPRLQTRGSQGVGFLVVNDSSVSALRYNGGPSPVPQPTAPWRVAVPTEPSSGADIRLMSREGNLALTNVGEDDVVRVVYRTRDDWTQQLIVAPRNYKKYDGTNTVRWRDYDFAPVTTATSAPTLVFHASEAGKSVRVAYSFQGTTQVQKREEILVIPEALRDNTGALLGLPASAKVARLEFTAPGNVLAIQSVTGESVHVRTAWLDNVRYNQSLLTSLRGGEG